jgi:alpha-ketoglutarate-dependent taurine dioxygenase
MTRLSTKSARFAHAPLHRDRIQRKLAHYEKMADDIAVEINNPQYLTLPERNALLQRIRRFNFVIYQCRSGSFTKSDLKTLGMQFGLNRLDSNLCADTNSISSVQVAQKGIKPRYIPYTDRPLGWHTDGYYNNTDKVVRSFILHCVTPAPEGGANSFLDPDVVFLLLDDVDEKLPAVLSNPESFTIPADSEQVPEPRSDRAGPVFSIDPASGALHMRYTARQHNITWNPDPEIRDAVECLKEVIDGASKYTLTHRLEAGQGVICNNVLHRRTSFADGDSDHQQRLIYRARYYDRVLGT